MKMLLPRSLRGLINGDTDLSKVLPCDIIVPSHSHTPQTRASDLWLKECRGPDPELELAQQTLKGQSTWEN